jgi:hypothetical protein
MWGVEKNTGLFYLPSLVGDCFYPEIAKQEFILIKHLHSS